MAPDGYPADLGAAAEPREEPDCLVTLDAGTGSGRCVVYDARGRPLTSCREPFHYRVFADPATPFIRGFDLEPERFWNSLARCARTAIGQLPRGASIRGVIATSQREACVLLDREGEVVYAGPNLDARAAIEGMEILQKIDEKRLHEITGHAPPYVFPAARYLWFRKHHPGVEVGALLMLNDWITYLLSGNLGAEHSNAGESMLYDVSRRDWSPEIVEALDVPRAILPELRGTGSRVGSVTAHAAAETGIPEGTPVFAGGADTECALLGSGAYEPGQIAAVLGTTCPVQLVTAEPIFDPQANLWTSCHVVADRWLLESNAGYTGGTYRWLLELLLGAADAGAHRSAEEAMARAGSSTRTVYCYLGPLIFDLKKINPFRPAGMLFPFPLLDLDRPSRGEILRGYLESVAFTIRANCEQIAAVRGPRPDRILISGGMAQSTTLLRILADALAIPLEISNILETASLGCAMLAAVEIGLYRDIPEAVHEMGGRFRIDPSVERTAPVEERYRKWSEGYRFLETWTV